MDIKNIMRNLTPSLSVMVVGLVGAYFVYNVYFSDRVASDFAGVEPAAGEEMVMDHGMEHDHHATEEGMIEELVEETGELLEAAEENVEEIAEEIEEMTDEAAAEKDETVDGDAVITDESGVDSEY